MTSFPDQVIDEILLSAFNTMAPLGATSTEEFLDILLGPADLITKGYAIELIRESRIDHDLHGTVEARLYGITPQAYTIATSLMVVLRPDAGESYYFCIPGEGTSKELHEKAIGVWRRSLGPKNIIPVSTWLVSGLPEAWDWKRKQKELAR